MCHVFEKKSHSGSFTQVVLWNVSCRPFEGSNSLLYCYWGLLGQVWFPAILLGATGTLGSFTNVPQSLQCTAVVSLCCNGEGFPVPNLASNLAIRPPKRFCWCPGPLSSDKCQFLFSPQGSSHWDIEQYCFSALKAHENFTKRIVGPLDFSPLCSRMRRCCITIRKGGGDTRGKMYHETAAKKQI